MISSLSVIAVAALAVANPVLKDVADAGVLRHAGRYYIMGVGTHGDIQTSTDLVTWSKRIHAFSMDNAWATGRAGRDSEIHACDFLLYNGRFHLYWSVNHGELRQIGHAVADRPTGPYMEPTQDVPFDGRIDPQCFRDNDGRFYFYTVRFGLGNVIFGQTMAGPATLSGVSKHLLSAVPDTWETLDQSEQKLLLPINEGPFVARNRDRYYLIYNANHTGPEFGNYALGVAESTTPLGFENAVKYGFPILRSNTDPRFTGEKPAPEKRISSCGQPNLVRGPNGLEWWLIYFADVGERRSQCIDRVHFFGPELVVDGPTLADTPGYHPAPGRPVFQDRFETGGRLAGRWEVPSEAQVDVDGLLLGGKAGMEHARATTPPMGSFVAEWTGHFDTDAANGAMGLALLDASGSPALRLGVDRARARWYLAGPGTTHLAEGVLPAEFAWTRPHAWRFERNHDRGSAELDGVQLFDHLPLGAAPLQPALFSEAATARFNHFMCTPGWDEFGESMRGWCGAAMSVRGGVEIAAGRRALRNDRMRQYEFSAQASGEGELAFIPAYLNDANYIVVSYAPNRDVLTVSHTLSGQPQPAIEVPVAKRLHRARAASETGYNLRAVKTGDQLILFVDGFEATRCALPWAAASVGLVAGETPVRFLATTCIGYPSAAR